MQAFETNPGPDDIVCPKCYYSLRGVQSRACPECGEPFDPKYLALSQRNQRGNVRMFSRVIWVLVTCFVVSLPPLLSLYLLIVVVPLAIIVTGVMAWGVASEMTVEQLMRTKGDLPNRGLYQGSVFIGIWLLYLTLCLFVIAGGCAVSLGAFAAMNH